MAANATVTPPAPAAKSPRPPFKMEPLKTAAKASTANELCACLCICA